MLGFTKFKINRLVNRRELYSNFSYNKWNQLDTGSKWKCLQQLENHFAAEQGRPAVKVLPISSKEVRGDYGGYDPDKCHMQEIICRLQKTATIILKTTMV